MELTEKQYEDIQNYLDGNMQPEAQMAFEQQLQEDPLLQEALRFEKELRSNLEYIKDNEAIEPAEERTESSSQFDDPGFILNLVEQAGKQEIRKTNTNPSPLHAIVNEEPTTVRNGYTSTFSFSRYVTAAACMIFLVMGVVWVTSNSTEPQPKAQADATKATDRAGDQINPSFADTPTTVPVKGIEPVMATVNTTTLFKKYYRRENPPAQTPEQLTDALNDYNAKDYVAIQQIDLDDLPKSRGPEAVEELQYTKALGSYFKGLSYMETGNLQQAIVYLQWVVDNTTNSQLRSRAQWYLALSYLKTNNSAKAIALLTAVSKNGDAAPFSKEAKELIAVLKSTKTFAE